MLWLYLFITLISAEHIHSIVWSELRRKDPFPTEITAKHMGRASIQGQTANFKCDKRGYAYYAYLKKKEPCISCVCEEDTQLLSCSYMAKNCAGVENCPVFESVASRVSSQRCCKACKKCNYLGIDYESEQSWRSTQDSCRMFTCKGGVVTMSRLQCSVSCANPQKMVGFCCPLCPMRSLDYSTSDNNRTTLLVLSDDGLPLVPLEPSTQVAAAAASADPCVQCQCIRGLCHCVRFACPALDCAESDQSTPVGHCCPECKVQREDDAKLRASGGCRFQNRHYITEQSFRPDPCTLCKCQDGDILCRRFVCPALDCPRQRLYRDPRLCCPMCRNRDPLSCKVRGKVYKHLERWAPDLCTSCVCQNGEEQCTRQKCPYEHGCPRGYKLKNVTGKCCSICVERDATCTVYGDPHYQTFDGKSYNFQGTCRYVLAKECVVSRRSPSAFIIIVRNHPRGTDHYAWTRHVSIRLPGRIRVSLLPRKRVHINRKPIKIPFVQLGEFSLFFDKQENLVFQTTSGVKVIWDGNSYVEVSVRSDYRGRLCGLCGNFNQDPSDDVTETRWGTEALSPRKFAESWKIGSWRSCKNADDQALYKNQTQRRHSRMRQRQKMLQQARQLLFGNFTLADRRTTQQGGDDSVRLPSNAVKYDIVGDETQKTQADVVEGDGEEELEDDDDDRDIVEEVVADSGEIESSRKCRWREKAAALAHCRLLKSALFGDCLGVVPVARFYQSCRLDTCECPASGRCYCESLLAYSRKCELAGVNVNWKPHTDCYEDSAVCPVRGSQFSPCVPVLDECHRSCDQLLSSSSSSTSLPIYCDNIPCRPGCACPDGFAVNLARNSCVAIAQCGHSAAAAG